jgi:asparagine synthase (glutamine-hydrolysing)
MCGIYGEFPFDKKLNPNLIINALAHRGPDDNGYLKFDDGIFVHTRLSIIDLSQNAKQPMSSKCGRYHIIYNGEIYNFLELKKDLIKKGYNFYSNSDTEVILVGFQEWKQGLFNKLNPEETIEVVPNRHHNPPKFKNKIEEEIYRLTKKK